MPFLTEITFDEGRLLLWEIDESIETMLHLGADFASDARFREIRNDKRRREWLASRILIRMAGCKNDQVQYSQNGKPTISHSQYHSISISHSGKLAGVFLHLREHCGLDIESVNRDFRKVEPKYLSSKESELAADTANGWALFWCIKEAVYKSAGIPGLSLSQQIRIERNENNNFVAILVIGSPVCYTIFTLEHDDQLLVCCIPSLQSGNS